VAARDLHAERSAKVAGLRYVSDAEPGIRREETALGLRYRDPRGRLIRGAEALKRIRRLAVPPAWTKVWICPREDGHLQATGRDARGRKQYRYHADWRAVRDETKFGRMAEFGRALPRIRRRVARDIALHGLPREKILATVVRLLETTFIRVGNEEYARENSSFGLTTLRTRQVRVNGPKIRFQFRGKSGVEHAIELNDARMAAIVRRVRELPGQELFQYIDEDGERRAIDSADVNAYIREAAGAEFTSKDFRTWTGTRLAAEALRRIGPFRSKTEGQRNVATAIEAVARLLGNTKAVCRKCYVHPEVVEAYLESRAPRATWISGAPRSQAHAAQSRRRSCRGSAIHSSIRTANKAAPQRIAGAAESKITRPIK
jgi:DNA topoisomerase-1